MERQVEFQVTDDDPQTRLVRTFDAPIEKVFAAWTTADMLRPWYGPHVTNVSECFMNLTEGGSYRIKMRAPDGTEYPMFGTVHNVRVPHHFELVADLSEHPDDFVHMFRPKGTALEFVPVRWYYEIDLREEQGVTTAEVRARYPVVEDRGVMISTGGAIGWSESFERLDALLAQI